MKKAAEQNKELSVGSCDRCGRRSSDLAFDDLSLRALCLDCRQDLDRRCPDRRSTAPRRS